MWPGLTAGSGTQRSRQTVKRRTTMRYKTECSCRHQDGMHVTSAAEAHRSETDHALRAVPDEQHICVAAQQQLTHRLLQLPHISATLPQQSLPVSSISRADNLRHQLHMLCYGQDFLCAWTSMAAGAGPAPSGRANGGSCKHCSLSRNWSGDAGPSMHVTRRALSNRQQLSQCTICLCSGAVCMPSMRRAVSNFP